MKAFEKAGSLLYKIQKHIIKGTISLRFDETRNSFIYKFEYKDCWAEYLIDRFELEYGYDDLPVFIAQSLSRTVAYNISCSILGRH